MRPLALLLLLAAPVAATPPAQETAPYQWRVLLDAVPDVRLTPELRAAVRRDLGAALASLAGPLARVEVVDLASADSLAPVEAAFRKGGWPALSSPAARQLTGVKRHFVRIAWRDGRYHAEARQLDGDTGLLSPLLRSQSASSPELLGRVAALLVGKDFGPVATVESVQAKENRVTLRFRAGAVAPLGKLAQVGDVLAVAAVADGKGGPGYGLARDFTLIRITTPPDDAGRCQGQLFSRYAKPLSLSRGVAGYRAMKLATAEAPVAVRLVHPQTGAPTPLSPLHRVRAGDGEFPLGDDPRDALIPAGGVFRSSRPMGGVACLIVGIGSVGVRIPVPVLGGPDPVAVPFASTEEDAARAAFEYDAAELATRAADHFEALRALRQALSPLIERGDNDKALARVTAGLASLQAGDKEVSEALARLKGGQRAKQAGKAAEDLRDAERAAQFVREQFAELEDKKRDLADARMKGQDPARFERDLQARDLQDRIKAHLTDGEVPAALDLLDRLFALTKDEAVKTRRDALAKEWEPKNPEHDAARTYLANDWRRAASPEEFRAAMPKVTEAVLLLRRVGDTHGLRLFVASLHGAYARLKEQADLAEGGDKQAISDVNKAKETLAELEKQARGELGAG